MPRNPDPGSVTTLCACGNRMGLRAGACGTCWPLLPPHLQQEWAEARGGPDAERMRARLRAHLRGTR